MNATPRAPSTALIRALFVGDDPSDRQLVTDLLDSVPTARFQIDWTRSLVDGLDRLKNGEIDVCLLNECLPDGDALDLLASLDVFGLMLPTILLTETPSSEQDRRALSLGASAYLDKGTLDPSMLERTIRYAVHHQKIARGLARQAFRDEATKLVSQALYRERLDRSLVFARRRNSEVAIMLIDLAFEADRDGHDELTDIVLAETGRRLAGDLRETDSIARLSNRRLALLIEGIRSLDHAATVARKVLRQLRTPIDLEHQKTEIIPSMGVAIYPREGMDGDLLMRQAEAAMRRAIAEGGGCCRFSSDRVDCEAREGMILEKAFGMAFERRELRLNFHPEVCMNGKQNGLACEISWHHPDRGWLPLDSRLADTDDEALIKGIADWALASTAEQLLAWQRAGLKQPCLSLALPFRRRPALSLLDQAVRDQVTSRQVMPDRIELDLQENLIVIDRRRGGADLASLKSTGVRLALDGFGRGRAAIQDLCHDVLDSLKLTSSLCRNLSDAGPSKMLLRALIDFGHGLGLNVTAKGARDQHDFAFLKRLGCDAVQLSAVPAMNADAATAWLQAIAKSPIVSDERKGLPSPEILVPKAPSQQGRNQSVDVDQS